jgi:hypothetical protein
MNSLVRRDQFTTAALRGNIKAALRTKRFATPAGYAIFGVLDNCFIGSFIQSQYIHRAASDTNAAAGTFFPVKVPDNHLLTPSYRKRICQFFA